MLGFKLTVSTQLTRCNKNTRLVSCCYSSCIKQLFSWWVIVIVVTLLYSASEKESRDRQRQTEIETEIDSSETIELFVLNYCSAREMRNEKSNRLRWPREESMSTKCCEFGFLNLGIWLGYQPSSSPSHLPIRTPYSFCSWVRFEPQQTGHLEMYLWQGFEPQPLVRQFIRLTTKLLYLTLPRYLSLPSLPELTLLYL